MLESFSIVSSLSISSDNLAVSSFRASMFISPLYSVISNINVESVTSMVLSWEKLLTGANDAFCYPFGHYNDTAEKVLKDAGYKMAFTTKGGRIKPGQNKYELPRVRMSKGISMKSFSSMVD